MIPTKVSVNSNHPSSRTLNLWNQLLAMTASLARANPAFKGWNVQVLSKRQKLIYAMGWTGIFNQRCLMKQLSKLCRLLNSLLSSDEIVPKVTFDHSVCNVGAHGRTKTSTQTSNKRPGNAVYSNFRHQRRGGSAWKTNLVIRGPEVANKGQLFESETNGFEWIWYMDVSKNRGILPPKWMVKIMENP